MPRRIHLYNDNLPAFETVQVTSVIEREEIDMQYKVVRPVERLETHSHRVPLGASMRQKKLVETAQQALNFEMLGRGRKT